MMEATIQCNLYNIVGMSSQDSTGTWELDMVNGWRLMSGRGLKPVTFVW